MIDFFNVSFSSQFSASTLELNIFYSQMSYEKVEEKFSYEVHASSSRLN